MILHYERPLAGSRGSSGHPLPGSSGLTPLRHPGYEKRTSPRCSLTLFLNQQPIEETSQRAVPLVRQRQDQPAVHPDRGAFFIARRSRHKVPKTPGYRRYALYIRPRQGVAPSTDRPLAGSRESSGHPILGSSGLRTSDTRAMKNAPLRGASRSPDALSYRTSRTGRTSRTSRTAQISDAPEPGRARQRRPAVHPDRGAFFVARVSRHKVPKTPGYRRYAFYIRPRQGSLPPSDAPDREQKKEDRIPSGIRSSYI